MELTQHLDVQEAKTRKADRVTRFAVSGGPAVEALDGAQRGLRSGGAEPGAPLGKVWSIRLMLDAGRGSLAQRSQGQRMNLEYIYIYIYIPIDMGATQPNSPGFVGT